MNVASLELSKELYELSGWKDTPLLYGGLMKHTVRFEDDIYTRKEMEEADGYAIHEDCPAYDLGYLLRKLDDLSDNLELTKDGFHWHCYMRENYVNCEATRSNIPEDAAAKLAIKLFKEGILKNDP